MSGSSHKVKRIRGVANISEKKIGDIGVLLTKRGTAARVKRNDELRLRAVLN